MKYFLFSLMVLSACSDNTPFLEEDEQEDDFFIEESVEEGPLAPVEDMGSGICSIYQSLTLRVDGVVAPVKIPVLCDPRPFIDEGRPALDHSPTEKIDRHQEPDEVMLPLTSNSTDTYI